MTSLKIFKRIKNFLFPPANLMLGRWRSTVINDNSQKQWFLFTSTQDNCYLSMYKIINKKEKISK